MPSSSQFLFNGSDANGNLQLWTTDGTQAGTKLVTVASSSSLFGLAPTDFLAMSTTTLFSGFNSNNALQLFTTDGTSAGTVAIIPAGAASTGLAPIDLTAFGKGALFAGSDAAGTQLWFTDGKAGGTTTDLTPGVASPGVQPTDITTIGTYALFNGFDVSGNQQLWRTDGTAGGTAPLAVVGENATGLAPVDITAFGTGALFFGTDVTGNQGLYTTDGTVANTTEIAANIGDPAAAPGLVVLGSKAVFQGTSGGLDQLFVTDGKSATALAVTGASSLGLQPTDITRLGTKAIFAGRDKANHTGLWVTDGTATGTTELLPTGASAGGLQPTDITLYGNGALFSGVDSGGKTELWFTDGTAAGTKEIAVTGDNTSGLMPMEIATLGTLAVFAGDDKQGNSQLWSYDGTALTEILPTTAASTGLAPGMFTVASVTTTTPCYAAGTRIRTPDGFRTVEALRPGDRVTTLLGGGDRPVRWVGERAIDLVRHPDPLAVQPIRICAGAFEANVPERDLVLSPDHAVHAAGVLVPVKYLINGTTIVREQRRHVRYFHVELDTHDVISAEGLAAETYLDTGDRAGFANAAAAPSRTPGTSCQTCAEITVTGPVLDALRRHLDARAADLLPRHAA